MKSFTVKTNDRRINSENISKYGEYDLLQMMIEDEIRPEAAAKRMTDDRKVFGAWKVKKVTDFTTFFELTDEYGSQYLVSFHKI